jgi:DNA-binding NarL/FixJ family response regulator
VLLPIGPGPAWYLRRNLVKLMLRVLICDRSPVVRSGMGALLELEPDIEVIDTTDSAVRAVLLARTAQPDVVVTGLDLRSVSGVELIRQLTELGAGSPRVVVYAMSDAADLVDEVLRAGANGLLVRDAHRGELAAAIRAVANGDAVLAPSVARRLVDWFRCCDSRPDVALGRVVETLTQREQEVLLLLARGMQPEEIAEKLFIGVTTVRTHIYRLRNKLSLKDRAQLVSFAYRAGLMQAGPSRAR